MFERITPGSLLELLCRTLKMSTTILLSNKAACGLREERQRPSLQGVSRRELDVPTAGWGFVGLGEGRPITERLTYLCTY